jgi:hypothetical protein
MQPLIQFVYTQLLLREILQTWAKFLNSKGSIVQKTMYSNRNAAKVPRIQGV